MKILGYEINRTKKTSLEERNRQSNLSDPADWFLQALGAAASSSGIKVTPLKALGVATVYACINVIARTLSSVPLVLYRQTNLNNDRATDHPLYHLLNSAPNDEMCSSDFISAMQSNLSLRNQAFAVIRRNRAGDVAEIYPVEAHKVSMNRPNPEDPITYRIDSNTFEPKNILHLRMFTFNGIKGIDLVSNFNDVIGLAIALQDNAAQFFRHGSRPSVVLNYPTTLKPEARKTLQESWDNAYGSLENAYKTAVLEGGMKVDTLNFNNKDSQFHEAREFQAKQIASFFGVPPHKVGIMSDATFSNIEQQAIEFVTDAILPIARRWEQTLNKSLLTKKERAQGYHFKFLINGLMRGDAQTRASYYAVMLQNGVMSPNEVRILEDMNPYEGGDEYFKPLNMSTTGEEEETPQNKRAKVHPKKRKQKNDHTNRAQIPERQTPA